MLLIVPLTTNLANVLLRSHDFELVQTVSAKKKIIIQRFKDTTSKESVQFILFNFANYLPSNAMELKVSKEITCK